MANGADPDEIDSPLEGVYLCLYRQLKHVYPKNAGFYGNNIAFID